MDKNKKQLVKRYQTPAGPIGWDLNKFLSKQDKKYSFSTENAFGEKKNINSLPEINLSTASTDNLQTIDPLTGLAKGTGTTNKTKAKAGFGNAMNIAASVADPAQQVAESAAKSLGVNIADKDPASLAVDTLSSGLMATGNPYAIAGALLLKGADTLDRSLGKTTKAVDMNAGSGFAGSNIAEAGKTFRFTQTGKANRYINDINNKKQLAGNAMNLVAQQNQLKSGAVDLANKKQFTNINKLGGFDTTQGLLAKKGTKLELKNIKAKAKYNHAKKHIPLDQNTGEIISGDAISFEQGGKFNVIPEGALHAHKHSIEDPDNAMTNKGIPVITIEEGGKVEQHAEIERNEITFHLEISKELEDLNKRYKDGDKEAAIEAGKLLVYEILENTDDRTGLIQTV